MSAGIAVASAPAKIILFGEHGVNRQQPALATAVDLRTFCQVTLRDDSGYGLRSGSHFEEGESEELRRFQRHVDELRAAQAFDQIRELARHFFAPSRYVLAHLIDSILRETGGRGVNVEWRSALPIGSGLGSGAAANCSMVLAASAAAGSVADAPAIVQAAWQGDVIAHGGVASSLDSSTSAYGGLIRYTAAAGAERLPFATPLPVVVGDTLVQHNTAVLNTHVRRWLEERPVRMRLFEDMGWVVRQATEALRTADMATLGHLMNIHQLFQEKMGTSVPQAERLIAAALEAGALGAKISGSGGGGIVIALCTQETQERVAAAIDRAGGCSYRVTSGTHGARLEPVERWDSATRESGA